MDDMTQKIGLFTGSFDPLTLGHLDLIKRASRLFDRLIVGVFYNPHKPAFLPLDKREDLLKRLLADFPQIEVVTSSQELVVDVAKRHRVTTLVRGLRSHADLDYEASLDFYNRRLAPEIEVCYLLSPPELRYVSSSAVRELLAFGADINPYVPKEIIVELEKISEQTQEKK